MVILDGQIGSLARKRRSNMSSLREVQSNSLRLYRDLTHIAKL